MTIVKTPRIGILVADFNALVTQPLVTGAQTTLRAAGVPATQIQVWHVPGALELPRSAQLIAHSGQVDGLIALGAVIRGETDHYRAVCDQTARGLADVSRTGPVPVMFGVLMTDNLLQALNRVGGKAGNKGSECAQGVLTMLRLERTLTAR